MVLLRTMCSLATRLLDCHTKIAGRDTGIGDCWQLFHHYVEHSLPYLFDLLDCRLEGQLPGVEGVACQGFCHFGSLLCSQCLG